MPERPRIFIASSTESLHVAVAVQALLADVGEVTCWKDAFRVASYYMDDLRHAAATHDFAIFVFTPDDELKSRGNVLGAPRDNVVFEMGLFSGRLGPRRVLVLMPEGGSTKVPSDLAGISYAGYRPPDAPPHDARWVGALRQASLEIQAAIESVQLADAADERDVHLGVSRVHSSFPYEEFARRVKGAGKVTLLNNWLPNLTLMTPALDAALRGGSEVKVLLLHPYSMATRTRESTLGRKPGSEPPYSVAREIMNSLDRLAKLARQLDFPAGLQVYVYPEIPAMPVYQADDYTLFGLFLRGRLAVASPQFEIVERRSVMAAVVSDQVEAVTASSQGPIDLGGWQDWLNGNL